MLKYALISALGDRAVNEDAVRVVTVANKICFVVCDGLGGHDRGDVASELVANTFAEELCFADDLKSFLLRAFKHAQKRVIEKQKEIGVKSKMKTTAVVFAADEHAAYAGHVGDSRFYAFKKDGKYIRTQDHSIPQILVNSETIKESEIRNHPSRNMLLKVIGEQYDEAIADLLEPLALDDYCAFLLCSDGFWELICEDEMIGLLQCSPSPQAWLESMLNVVRTNGSAIKMDNYSAIAIFNVHEKHR